MKISEEILKIPEAVVSRAKPEKPAEGIFKISEDIFKFTTGKGIYVQIHEKNPNFC